jgi:hypothetical protein
VEYPRVDRQTLSAALAGIVLPRLRIISMIGTESAGSLTAGVLQSYVEDVRPRGTGAWREISPAAFKVGSNINRNPSKVSLGGVSIYITPGNDLLSHRVTPVHYHRRVVRARRPSQK